MVRVLVLPSTSLKNSPPLIQFLALKFKPHKMEISLELPIYKFMLGIVTLLVLVALVLLILNVFLVGDSSGTTTLQDLARIAHLISILKEVYACLALLVAVDVRNSKG